jgi:spermidine/putrescine transport system permease protein
LTATARSSPPRPRRRRAPGFLLAIPSFVWYVFIFVIPVGLVVVNSFGRRFEEESEVGRIDLSDPSLDRYRDVVDGQFTDVLKQTMRTSLLGTALCLVVALPVAYFLAFKLAPRARAIVLALLMIPFFTNYLLRTLAWKIVLQPRGFISNFLQDEHWFTLGQALRDTPLQLLDTRAAVQLAIVYNYIPLMIFPIWVALDRVELHLREASKDLGAGRLRTLLQVTLPLAAPGIVAGVILVFVPLSGDYVTPALLGGAKGNMLGAEVYAQYYTSQDAASGSALAVSLIISILVVLGVGAAVVWFFRQLLRRSRAVKRVSA